jgi:hypothetical protein
MRKVLLATMAATLLITMLGGPATAEPVGKAVSFPLDYTFVGEDPNPCTGETALTHFVGRLDIQALPSIEAFFNGAATHSTLKWAGQFTSDDGYSTQDNHYATLVINDQLVDPPHVVFSDVGNIMFSGSDGGKFKISSRFHLTIVDGEVKTEIDRSDARCIRQPRG